MHDIEIQALQIFEDLLTEWNNDRIDTLEELNETKRDLITQVAYNATRDTDSEDELFDDLEELVDNYIFKDPHLSRIEEDYEIDTYD